MENTILVIDSTQEEFFADFEVELCCRHTCPGQNLRDTTSKPRIDELTLGEIHRDTRSEALAVEVIPNRDLSDGLPHHDLTKARQQARLLGHREKSIRAKHAMDGMKPTNETLEPNCRPGRDGHDRLGVNLKLAVG